MKTPEVLMKRKPFLIVIVLLVAFLLLFVACSKKQNAIPVPKNLALDDDLLTWDAVTGAVGYDVKVDDNVYTTEENRFTISVSDYDEHEVCVRANTYDGTGKYSAVITYKRSQKSTTLPQLAAPRVSMTSNRVMWSTILNNNGYKIYFDGKSYVTEKNATYYDLDLSVKKDGRYEVTMQTLGDGVSYATSAISSSYMVTVKDCKAPLQSLAKVDFTFNAEEKVLEWRNRYSAEAVSYEIYQDNSAVPLVTIPADATKVRLTYAPVLTGGRVSYTMRLVSNNGLYAASSFNDAIAFPIADAAPADLAVAPDVDKNGYFIEWGARDYVDGYVVEIDGVEYPATTELCMMVPAALTEGRHVVRVRTSGAGVYYADSLYSGGIVFYTEANGRMTTALDTPAAPVVRAAEDAITLHSLAVSDATSYRWCFVGASGTSYISTSGADATLTAATVDSRAATAEESAAIAKIRADLATGVKVSVVAVPESELFTSSPASAEGFVVSDGTVEYILPPEEFRYDAKGFAWVAETGTAVTYELMLDGVLHSLAAGETVRVTAGSHVARLRRGGTNALWSEEIFFRAPVDLVAPADLKETSGILTFTGTQYANGYLLYANGTQIATVYPSESMIMLSTYIKTDGRYVLSMRAISTTGAVDSPMSGEYLYVKTDGEYGTAAKPFIPHSAAELLSLMRENTGAYFELVSGAVYDYTNYDFSAVNAFEFNGVLLGNGATMKGLRLRSPLFTVLARATVRNLTVEIDAGSFTSPLGGVLAQSAQDTVLANLTVKVTGNVAFSRSATFGVLFYRAEGLTMREVTLNYDLSLSCGENCVLGAVAYDCKGSVNALSLAGRADLRGASARFSGIGATGEMTVNGFAPTMAVSLKGDQNAVAAGCSSEGRVTASSLSDGMTMSLDAPNATYYGVAQSGASVSDSVIGGRVETTRGNVVSLYGVGEDGIALLKNVTVGSLLKGSAVEELFVAGIADELGDVDSAGSAFTGRMELAAEDGAEVVAAGLARTLTGTHALRSAGTIALTGGQATLTAGAVSAQDLTLQNQSKLILASVPELHIGGAAGSVSGALTVTGSLEVQATDCGDTHFGGVVASGDQSLSIRSYRVFGSIDSETAQVAGVSYEGRAVVFSALDLTVDLGVLSPSIRTAGALLGATSLSVDCTPSLSVTIDGQGSGLVAGLGLGLSGIALSDFSLSGALSLTGSGQVFGVAQDMGQVSGVTSSASLTAEGAVVLYGLFERVSQAADLTFAGDVTVRSNSGAFYGLTESVSSGRLDGGSLLGVTLQAVPQTTSEPSELRVFGLTDRIPTLTGATVSGVTYTVGAFDTFTFGGIANSFSDTVQGGNVDYTLDSSAKQAFIGGAFTEGSGRITSLTLGGTSPLRVTSKGATELGGMILSPGNVTVSKGSSYLDLVLTLPETSASAVGGLLGVLDDNRVFTLSDHAVNLTVTRTGGGTALVGGVVADLRGSVQGATADVTLTSSVQNDVLGGLAARSLAATVSTCLVRGSITAPCNVGGLVGECTGGTVDGSVTAVTIRSENDGAGGLFAEAINTTLSNVYSVSRLTNHGYGFFKSGENLSMDFCYFAGEAHDCSLAYSVENCVVNSVFADAALSDLPIVQTGTLACEYRSFGYGYTSLELGSAFVADGVRYPYLAALGYPLRNAIASTQNRPALNVEGSVDLYADLSLPRLYDAATPTVTWVDADGKLEIENGVATVIDNGSGVLYGVLAGGVRVYRVEYTASGFVPLAGEGTSESPYLVEDIRYLHHVASYAENDPTAYFKLLIEGGTLENAAFDTLFTSTKPFRGTFDFNNVVLSSPEIGENGIFGYLNGATVKNLVITDMALTGALLARSAIGATVENVTLSGTVSGNACLIGTLTDGSVSGVTVKASCITQTEFALFDSISGVTIQNVSARVSVNSGDDVTLALFGSAQNATVQNAQALFYATMAGKFTASLVGADNGSAYTSVMLIADATYCNAESEAAGFAFSATSSTVENAAFLTAGDFTIYPLVKEGAATYTSVKVLSAATFETTAGVTVLTIAGARDAIALMTGYQSGVVYTPLGFDLLLEDGATPDHGFTLDQSELELTARLPLKDAFLVAATEPLARMLTFAYAGTGATIVNGVLRPTGMGSGTLTATNFYGETQTVAVTVNYDGFASGEGTYDDPYLIESFDDFKRIPAYAGSVYQVTTDISGTLTESFAFSGTLIGTAVTVTVTLSDGVDFLFENAGGTIDGVNFLVTKEEVSVAGGGLFAVSASGLRLNNCTIRVECATVTLTEEDVVFGMLFGRVEDSEFDTVTVTLANASVTAQSGAVGLVAGSAENTVVNGLSVAGNVTLTAAGAVDFGAFGRVSADSETYLRQVGADPENVEAFPYVDGVLLGVTLSASGEVTMGGFAGRCGVKASSVTGTASLTITGGTATAGGAVGVLTGTLADGVLTSVISATVTSGVFGGLVGDCEGVISDCDASAEVTVTGTGKVIAGGVAGEGEGSVRSSTVSANVSVHSTASSEEVAALVALNQTYAPIVAAGGAVGYFRGSVSGVSVTVNGVSATTDHTGGELCSLAGGVAGYLRTCQDVEVKGSGSIAASGGVSYAAGGVALLGENFDRAVISGVSLSASNVGWACSLAALREEGGVSDVYATVGDESGSLVKVLTEDATIEHCGYLYGVSTLTVGADDRITETQKLASTEAFYATALYENFDTDVWQIDGTALPTLK